MSGPGSAERGAPALAEARAVGPWRYATLVVTCPRCEAGPGDRCTWETGRPRKKPHLERYALARQLAGFPLSPRRPLP